MYPTLALLALLFAPQANQAPDPTQPPASAHLRYTAVGYGVQIYQCTAAQPTGQPITFSWTLEAPEAALFDPTTQKQIGTHAAGPTWTFNDGSAITGKVLQKQPSPDPAAIPWLLLETHPANDVTGALNGITLVRRSNTKAGAAPATGCDAQHYDIRLRVPYEATYTFYSAN
jgi:hypothetical protein